MKNFLIDITKCVGCHDCQIGCKDEHCGNDWSPIAKPQPETGQFWCHLLQFERGANSHVRVTYLPVICQHCENPACAAACPADAFERREDGILWLNPEKCTGCGDCVEACPYDAVFFNEELNIAQKCTGCAHLLDGDEPIKVPRCFDNCHVGVFSWGEEDELDLEGAEKLHPEYGTAPRVWYKGLPKRFVAGTVYDPVAKEIIEGAKVVIAGDKGTFETTTDEWGDFRFLELAEADWTLTIEAGGKKKELAVSTVEKDIGLPDIALA